MNATEQQIAKLATEVTRYRFALLSCAVGARNGLESEEQSKAALEFIRDEAIKALEYEEANNNGETLHGNTCR